LAVKENEL
jgi:WD40 repeat protein